MVRTISLLSAILASTAELVSGADSYAGKTTRYWDCCKPSCAWSDKATVSSPVNTCNANNQLLSDVNAKSSCDGGTSFMCSNQIPWVVKSSLSYGYAAVHIAGQSEFQWCCACYELTFTSGAVAGKKMIVQATNTGGDLGNNQFDLAIPGGGVGNFNGCTAQYNAPANGWGARSGGVSSRSECDQLPAAIRPGCYWRFDWFGGSDNPTVNWKVVQCPSALTVHTGCVRK